MLKLAPLRTVDPVELQNCQHLREEQEGVLNLLVSGSDIFELYISCVRPIRW